MECLLMPNSDDHVLEDNGIQLVMDPTSRVHAGSEVDFDDGLSGKGFVPNPNAGSTRLWPLFLLIKFSGA